MTAERLTPREVVQEIDKHRRSCPSCYATNKSLNAEHARWFHLFVMGLVDAERNWELGVTVEPPVEDSADDTSELVCSTCKRPYSEAENHILCPCGSEDFYNERYSKEEAAKRAALVERGEG